MKGDQNMAEVKWIKIAIDIFDNRKIAQIEAMPDGDAIIVIWIKLLCLAGSINDRGQIYLTQEIPYTEPMLATQFRRSPQTVHLALQTFEAFGMIEIENDILKVSNWERYQNVDALEKMREQNRKRVAKHREKVKAQALEDKSVTLQNITETLPTHYSNEIEEDKNQNQIQSNTTTAALRKKAYEESNLPYSFDYKIRQAFRGKKCPVCGAVMQTTVDETGVQNTISEPTIQHNTPISKGGKHELGNISVICKHCNFSIQDNETGPLNADDVTAEWEKISEKTTSPYTGENALRRPVFDLADGSAYAPSDEKVAEWIKAFPQLDVEKCLREAAAKNNAHSGQDMRRRKNALTVEPYIVNWLIVESGQAEKAAKERRRNGFSDMPEHGDEITVEELRERNGNLI